MTSSYHHGIVITPTYLVKTTDCIADCIESIYKYSQRGLSIDPFSVRTVVNVQTVQAGNMCTIYICSMCM